MSKINSNYPDEEAIRRRDEALRRALNTPPPKPNQNPKAVKPAVGTSAGKRGPTAVES